MQPEKRIDQLTKEQQENLLSEFRKPMTDEYRKSFWDKIHHNENILSNLRD